MKDVDCDKKSAREFKESIVGLRKQEKFGNSSNWGVTLGFLLMTFLVATNDFYNFNLFIGVLFKTHFYMKEQT